MPALFHLELSARLAVTISLGWEELQPGETIPWMPGRSQSLKSWMTDVGGTGGKEPVPHHNKPGNKPNHPARMLTRNNNLQRGTRRKATVVTNCAIAAPLAGLQSRSSISAPQLTAQQRFHLLARFKELRSGGLSAAKAAQRVGSSKTTLWRYAGRLAAGGLQSLAPQGGRRGRRGIAEQCGLTPSLVKQLQALCLAAGNIQRGFVWFSKLPVCPPRLARVVGQVKTIPPSLRQLVSLQPVQFTGVRVGNRMVMVQKGGCA